MNNPSPSGFQSRLCHGGHLREAAAQYGIAEENWIDLSTGISPWGWPVPPLPESVWRRLPEENDRLCGVAADYYGCPAHQLLAVPGTQWAISQLPRLRNTTAVALPIWGYQEHEYRWQQAGHRPVFYGTDRQLYTLVESGAVDCAVVINPNNPTAERIQQDTLRHMGQLLAARNGFLLVDEAFIDATPQHSLVFNLSEGLVILRSTGKFFGLAGLRLGFVVAASPLIAHLQARLDPWAVSHPARWVGAAALADNSWQQRQRRRLAGHAQSWGRLLRNAAGCWHFDDCQLFFSARGPRSTCYALYEQCAQRGLLIRVIAPVNDSAKNDAIIRIGLPAEHQAEEAITCLSLALECCP